LDQCINAGNSDSGWHHIVAVNNASAQVYIVMMYWSAVPIYSRKQWRAGAAMSFAVLTPVTLMM